MWNSCFLIINQYNLCFPFLKIQIQVVKNHASYLRSSNLAITRLSHKCDLALVMTFLRSIPGACYPWAAHRRFYSLPRCIIVLRLIIKFLIVYVLILLYKYIAQNIFLIWQIYEYYPRSGLGNWSLLYLSSLNMLRAFTQSSINYICYVFYRWRMHSTILYYQRRV